MRVVGKKSHLPLVAAHPVPKLAIKLLYSAKSLPWRFFREKVVEGNESGSGGHHSLIEGFAARL
jgi:hypothetical protein